jgi:Reverse transcriptase (RNA-dependent DNA polymerase)
MPFRLINTSAIYQALINNILREYLNNFVVIYLDNILIYNKNEKKYTSHIIKVLETLRRTELKINEEKSTFYQTEVKFLEYILIITDIKMNPKKVKTVLDWLTLITIKKM